MRNTAIPWAEAAATALEAGIASVRGEPRKSLDLLIQAEYALQASDTPMHAEAAGLRRGLLEGGSDAIRRAQAAKLALTEPGVVDPLRFSRYLVPVAGDDREP
jgi:hypothetical protein